MSTMSPSPHATDVERPTPQLRLTRRGRLLVFIAAMLTVLAIAVAYGATSMAANETGAPQETEVVMVGEGETLWDIAAERTTDGDVRAAMRVIEDLNALDSSRLMVGQEIHVPVTD